MIHYIDSNKYNHQDEWFEQACLIYKMLPKHNEWFGDWEVTQTSDSLRFQGRYFVSEFTRKPVDIVDFTVIFSKDPEKNFRLQFNGRTSQSLAKKYHLRGYLENEIIESLYDLGGFPDFIYSLTLDDFI